MSDPGSAEPPLTGIRVLELAQNVAVPYCGRLLAAMGADVVKVEPPVGDAMRHLAPLPARHEAKAYAVVNPGKRSVVVDLDHPSARTPLDALVRWADVVLVALKPPDVRRYELGYEQLRQRNPEIVYLEHVALGSEGPEADKGGYDVLVQALSGLSFVTSRSERGRPLTVRPAYNDVATGMLSALAVVAALRHRDRTGQGQRVRTSLLGTALGLGTPIIASFEITDPPVLEEFSADLEHLRAAGVGFDDQRSLYEERVMPGGAVFELWFRHYLTADGLVAIGALSAALWERFHEATGLPHPGKAGWTAGSDQWDQLITAAERLFAGDTTESWLRRMREHGVPASRYNLPHEALVDPQIEANGFVVDLEHPDFGRYRTTDVPFRMDRTPVRTTGPSPRLGADTTAVLTEAGLSPDSIDELARSGATAAREAEGKG